MTTKWLVDQHIIDHNEQDILAALSLGGFDVKVGQFQRFAKKEDVISYFQPDDCVVVYGSREFVDQQKKKGHIPGAYCQDAPLECATYIPNIPSDLLLNSEHVFATFGDFVRRKDFFYKALSSDTIFIRPNSGRKVFTGLAIARGAFDHEVNCLRGLTSVGDETLILVAPSQDIVAEYRLIVVNRQVAAGSLYMANGQPCVQEHVPAHVWAAAELMAANEWQPDIVYVCDIAETKNGSAKILEINPFSCSGLYACNLPVLFDAVSKAARLEYEGELSVGDIPHPVLSASKPKC